MKSCVSLHRFRISADPLGWLVLFSNYGEELRPSMLSGFSVLSAPAQKSCAFSLDGLRPINQSSKTVPYGQAQRSCLTALLCTAYASTMYGYVTSRHGTLSSLMVLGLNQRYMLISLPALSLVPDALAPPNGCWPITAPVGLSLM